MTLKVSDSAMLLILSNFRVLSNKMVVVLDASFELSDLGKNTLERALKSNTRSLTDSENVLATFTLPEMNLVGSSGFEFNGPISFTALRDGTIGSFIILEEQTGNTVVGANMELESRVLFGSTSVNKLGLPGSMVFSTLQCSTGVKNTFFNFNGSILVV